MIFKKGQKFKVKTLHEFYITNKKTTYLLAFNHHDYLIACGDSEKWLKSKVDIKSI